jgi:deoxyadenosine/deoxycytidine kinase
MNPLSIDYLSRLNERYGDFLRDRGKILIDVDNINFVDKPEDLGTLSPE